MKTYTFKLFGHTFTIHFGKKTKEEIKMEDNSHRAPCIVNPNQYVSTINEPDEPYGKSFYSCCIDYIESQRGTLADSTLKSYRNICDNHLDAIMEMCLVDEINEDIIQEAFDAEIAKGLSEKTLKGYRSFVIKVLSIYRPDLILEVRIKPFEERPLWTTQKAESKDK